MGGARRRRNTNMSWTRLEWNLKPYIRSTVAFNSVLGRASATGVGRVVLAWRGSSPGPWRTADSGLGVRGMQALNSSGFAERSTRVESTWPSMAWPLPGVGGYSPKATPKAHRSSPGLCPLSRLGSMFLNGETSLTATTRSRAGRAGPVVDACSTDPGRRLAGRCLGVVAQPINNFESTASAVSFTIGATDCGRRLSTSSVGFALWHRNYQPMGAASARQGLFRPVSLAVLPRHLADCCFARRALADMSAGDQWPAE